MKKLVLLPLALCLFLLSCEDYEKQVNDLKAKNDSLVREGIKRDSSINDFLSSFNEIENNLAQIRQKERIITMESGSISESNTERKDKINNEILQIYELLQSNKQKLSELEKKLKHSNYKIIELQKTIQKLQTDLTERDSTIHSLRDVLKGKNLIIDSLYKNIDSLYFYSEIKDEIITDQVNKLNTAYYVIGGKKELIANEILDKKGGFVGINKIVQLKNDFNKDYFTQININETKAFPLFVKDAEIVTNHPSDSYELIESEQIDSLKITDPKAFWEVSKYLVIIVN